MNPRERRHQAAPPWLGLDSKDGANKDAFQRFPKLLRELFGVVDELEALFSRPFTPDGHMVGSIGEVVAAFIYGLDLFPCSSQGHDARAKCGAKVQVKLTAGTDAIGIYGEP